MVGLGNLKWNEYMNHIRDELQMLFSAHRAVGLVGQMLLYTEETQEPWRSKSAGQKCWFAEYEIDKALAFIEELYNGGKLPNSTPLLNPIIHDEHYNPLGSGFCWATGLCLGVAQLEKEQIERVQDLGVQSSFLERGEVQKAGLKMLGFSATPLSPKADGKTVVGCAELFALSNIQGVDYAPYYLLSGLRYLCTHGIFAPQIKENILVLPMDVQQIVNAAQCFVAYDRQHSLYMRFGINPADIEHNNRFYNLCARDLALFDRTGPMRKGAGESFEFLVPGYIPRGAVTLLAASGGTGKSSAAHHLCVMASMDWSADEPAPKWLGQPLNLAACNGVCVYFSGEDGPAIINARGNLFDPEGRAMRLQFHRTEFVDRDISFADYLRELSKMPNVPLVVIDPARKYLSGDENDSDSVSQFFEAIEEFAVRKNAAVIVVHHLEKGANPQSARQILECLRGSQVFIDRPRVVIGMFRDGKHTVVGLAKNNIPPNLGMATEERVFARDPRNLQLLWLPGKDGVRSEVLSEEELEQLEAEARALRGEL